LVCCPTDHSIWQVGLEATPSGGGAHGERERAAAGGQAASRGRGGKERNASAPRRGIRGGEVENTHHQASTGGSERRAEQRRAGEGGGFRFRTYLRKERRNQPAAGREGGVQERRRGETRTPWAAAGVDRAAGERRGRGEGTRQACLCVSGLNGGRGKQNKHPK